MEYVRRVYRAFWCNGRDISDQAVLTQLLEGLGEGEADEQSRRMAGEWESAWHQTGQAGVPLMVSSEGYLLVGCAPIENIQRFFA